ncbi:MAG: response regulator transcription factor [Candidatus Melainabacteria bacterium]|nr:response regulator transcription factor [Candidatus Melainabacteria bacterium]
MSPSEETPSKEQTKAPRNQIAIMLVEDHLITRMGLRFALEQVDDLKVVAEAADGIDAVSTALQVKPSVILMDIGLPGINGIDAAQQIKATDSKIGIIMLTSHSLDEDIMAALAANCDGYCLKDVAADQLVNAIRSVHNGGIWLDPAIAKRVIKAFVEQKPAAALVNNGTLTERELEVLTLVVEGLSNQEIADRLVLSTETIKTHMRHLMEKLSVTDRTQAAVKALRTGLV